ncbi:MAG: HAD-IA family hydrolase, partial [Verrucomicrobiae bacterium]|nr:HAD-IA family hydrolase [Verrucomicrobiae bacterium]
MTTRYRAVLFDLDGTLIDSLADLANATNYALAKLGCPTHPREAYRYFVGDGARTLCARALPADRQDLVERALELMRAHYERHCFDESRPYPGIEDLLAALQRRAVPMAVLSNKPDAFTKRVVRHFFPKVTFAVVRGQLLHLPLKPDPMAARQIAEDVGIEAAHWLYLGDTNTDMRTARAAGMFAVGALWGFRPREELEEAGAEAVVAAPSEVLRWFPAQPTGSTERN